MACPQSWGSTWSDVAMAKRFSDEAICASFTALHPSENAMIIKLL
jgi:hypothetical protein